MTSAGAPLLSCRKLTKSFGALTAVKNFSFDLEAGETLGIGGPNGAGKTTLFDVISGLTSITEGEVLFEGRDVTLLSAEQICHRGLLRTFQFNAGFESLTVAETALAAGQFGRDNRWWPGIRFSQAARTRCEEAIAFVGLARWRDAPTGTLSILERKLLMIASALAAQPRLLLLDEPAGGLTPKEINQMIGVVEGVKAQGISIILIEHVMRFLVRLSSRVIIMHHGEKIYDGPPEGFARDPLVVEVYLGAGAASHLNMRPAGREERR
jgi:branched-chain amino acid transport system ATP-binding protein